MNLIFSPQAWDDYLYWQDHDAAMVERINLMIGEARRTPFRGLGKPQPLRDMAGWWSRRLNRQHRLIYRVTGKDDAQTLEIAASRFHYTR